MAETIPVISLKLQYEGLFDFDGMYTTMIDWAKNYGFLWHEADYKHKVPDPFGAEQEYKWIMTKTVDTYISYKIVIEGHTWEHTEMTVDVEGKKKNLAKARVYITLKGEVNHDTLNIFGSSEFAKKLGKWYGKILKREIEGHYDTITYRLYNLHALMKNYFDMQSKKYAYKGYLGEH
ncbi:hypothetical protein J4437_04070 [Candidatus Woesearchaeota archaeon]|nr:hypothetical protein [uncultured archaeon]MBS3123787.1 hypothetical protein [Candidatus Woesearchaeota archaeon]